MRITAEHVVDSNGFGVVASDDIQKGQHVLTYWGKVWTSSRVLRLEAGERDRLDASSRLLITGWLYQPADSHNGERVCIEGSYACAATYVNTPGKGVSPNVAMVECDMDRTGVRPVVKLVALQEIKAGTELLVNYGKTYPLTKEEENGKRLERRGKKRKRLIQPAASSDENSEE